jgi:trehalose 6-phosphate phosphatase
LPNLPELFNLPELVLPLAQRPGESALFLDFDGTLSAIVRDPVAARPLPGVPRLLSRLAERVALVAVISGRPKSFLAEVLDAPAGVQLLGLYGLEMALEAEGQGLEAAAWSTKIADVALEATVQAPEGTFVEPKGLTVTLHWRQAPETEGWVTAFAQRQHQLRGLAVHPGRASIELRPPLEVDKGTVIRTLVGRSRPPLRVVGVFGDDLGDLPGFDAAAALRDEGLNTVTVAVVDDESPPEMAAGADLTVDGPTGAVALLEHLLEAIDQGAKGA